MSAFARLLTVCLAALALVACAAAKAAPSRVPAGVTSIRIDSAAGITNVTRPAAVQKIVTWFDTLPHFVAHPCPYSSDQPPDVRFVFRAAGGGVALRAVDHLPGTCEGSMTSKGRLFADDGFVARVSKLTGVDFDPNAGTRQNKAAAKLDEQMLLGRVRVPPGSQPIAKSQESRTWRVHLPLDQVFAWEDAHRPRGSTKDGAGTGSKWGVLTDRELMYLYPPIAGRISDRRLNFNLIVKPGGWTRIYVWVQDTPIVARSPNERLPVGVTQVVFRSHLITDHAKVAKIVHWFDALPIVQPGIGSCAWYSSNSSVVHLDFGNAAGNVVAHASLALRYGLRSDRCSPITFDVGGHPQSPIDGGDFFRRVKRLVG